MFQTGALGVFSFSACFARLRWSVLFAPGVPLPNYRFSDVAFLDGKHLRPHLHDTGFVSHRITFDIE